MLINLSIDCDRMVELIRIAVTDGMRDALRETKEPVSPGITPDFDPTKLDRLLQLVETVSTKFGG